MIIHAYKKNVYTPLGISQWYFGKSEEHYIYITFMEKIAFIFLTQIDNHTNIENSVNQELFIINSILIDCDRFMNLESIQDKISILSLKNSESKNLSNPYSSSCSKFYT